VQDSATGLCHDLETLAHGHTRSVITAIHTLRARFAEPIRVEELASIARMSPSAFHRQFKEITSVTLLPYQKQLRLLEARRLMSDAMNVETAAFEVGYESPRNSAASILGCSERRPGVMFPP
jgi:transcriptional regulator GlxA family with amidase domain